MLEEPTQTVNSGQPVASIKRQPTRFREEIHETRAGVAKAVPEWPTRHWAFDNWFWEAAQRNAYVVRIPDDLHDRSPEGYYGLWLRPFLEEYCDRSKPDMEVKERELVARLSMDAVLLKDLMHIMLGEKWAGILQKIRVKEGEDDFHWWHKKQQDVEACFSTTKRLLLPDPSYLGAAKLM